MKLAILLCFFLVGIKAWSQGTPAPQITGSSEKPAERPNERSIEVQVDEKNSNIASRLLLEQATEKISEQVIRETIGVAKFNRNLSVIQNKVLKLSSRFVPLAKPGELIQTENGFKMSVVLRVSPEELQQVLLENGLFYDSDVAPIIIPFVSFEDKVEGQSYSWWNESQSPLSKWSRDFEIKLRRAFWKNGFYLMRPQGYRFSEMLSASDFEKRKTAGDLNAQIYVEGLISVKSNYGHNDQNLIVFHLMALQTSNNRSIAEVTRQFEAHSGATTAAKFHEVLDSVSQDLANQILETWQKGSLGANSLLMTFLGPITLKQRELLRQDLQARAQLIKSAHERKIGHNSLTWEIESGLTPKELGARLAKIQVGNSEFVFKSSDEKSMVYEVNRPQPKPKSENANTRDE
jgi:hypothetical protein